MGGGPCNTDIVRACCILTFPKETQLDPVPLDGWFLYATGLQYVHKIATDCSETHANASILLRFLSEDTDNATRYITCGSDQLLREALKKIFGKQNISLLVHIVYLKEWNGEESINVRLEDNPNFSPTFVPQELKAPRNRATNAPLLVEEVIDGFCGRRLDQNFNNQTFEPFENDDVPNNLEAPVETGRTIEASGSRFFLSSSWHLQAEEMSASMRLQSKPMRTSRTVEDEETMENNIDSSFVVIN
uniref:Uncharacterized protein AlNc14C226G9214 n=1 Tax=Albugo laibachii Nc14 TaxID=890382 RepID=F0WS76_9STRA|nr:conserved hypothetical protein [Albugo laibachii Nc14]|eukprot:CCA24194.1 conserved hypothetical protein [Albugo laibachii Nc14]